MESSCTSRIPCFFPGMLRLRAMTLLSVSVVQGSLSWSRVFTQSGRFPRRHFAMRVLEPCSLGEKCWKGCRANAHDRTVWVTMPNPKPLQQGRRKQGCRRRARAFWWCTSVGCLSELFPDVNTRVCNKQRKHHRGSRYGAVPCREHTTITTVTGALSICPVKEDTPTLPRMTIIVRTRKAQADLTASLAKGKA